jgi:Putative DNA-binding domain
MYEAAFNHAIGDWSSVLPHGRMAVYRNNVVSALVNALRVRYPVTEQLVGKEFFSTMARRFADLNRPASPVLIDYGAALPGFIANFAPAASVPYLSDVAALESLWWQSYHAADAGLASAEDLMGVPAENWGDVRFRFHPSMALLRSKSAAASIWLAHHGGTQMGQFDALVPEHVLIARPGSDVIARVVSAASHDLLVALRDGIPLAEAVETIAMRHDNFDITTQLRGLLGLDIITGLEI